MNTLKSIQEHFPGKDVLPMQSLPNVFEIPDENVIAKSVVYFEDDPEMSRERARDAYERETRILRELPSWWGLQYVGSFATDSDFVLLTRKVRACKWNTRIPRPDDIAYQLTRQLTWLHEHTILHNDLESKNVLLTCDGTRAILIDFEKSRSGVPVTPEESAREFETLKSVLPASVARYLPMKGRPRSQSAGRRRETPFGRRRRSRNTYKRRRV